MGVEREQDCQEQIDYEDSKVRVVGIQRKPPTIFPACQMVEKLLATLRVQSIKGIKFKIEVILENVQLFTCLIWSILHSLPCMAFHDMSPVYLFGVILRHSLPQTLKLLCPFLYVHIHVVSYFSAFTHAISSSGNPCPPHLATNHSSFKTLLRCHLLQVFSQWFHFYYCRLGLDATPL